jgi:hypothetical protein
MIAAILIVLVCAGCTVTRERAVRVAVRALADRKLQLPAHYEATVSEGHAAIYAGGSYDLWYVYFTVPGRKQPLYTVRVDQRFATVEIDAGY